MSLVPLLFSDWWEDLDRPHNLFDQHFGLPLDPEDLAERIAPRSELLLYKPGKLRHRSSRYHPFLHSLMRRSGRGSSTVTPDKDKFVVTLDVQQFHPEEINVKVVDNTIIVEAKHEEKEDEHGWISRQFTRKYLVPNQCDVGQVESQLSSDGVLTITAPKKEPPKADSDEKVIKIRYTGEPAVTNRENAAVEGSSGVREGAQQRQAPQRGKKSTVKAA
ncbi:protein lethal(2)essential for life [Nasonia vitripennis]|uniref:SHSP domain-containing protein n=1 Tax=Nasonia vitripennis TaxID=7425 RepID=A0A7M7H0T4_NASVI|nr:protein lethal(2)essential for life [Nasonia vitripennis]